MEKGGEEPGMIDSEEERVAIRGREGRNPV